MNSEGLRTIRSLISKRLDLIHQTEIITSCTTPYLLDSLHLSIVRQLAKYPTYLYKELELPSALGDEVNGKSEIMFSVPQSYREGMTNNDVKPGLYIVLSYLQGLPIDYDAKLNVAKLCGMDEPPGHHHVIGRVRTEYALLLKQQSARLNGKTFIRLKSRDPNYAKAVAPKPSPNKDLIVNFIRGCGVEDPFEMILTPSGQFTKSDLVWTNMDVELFNKLRPLRNYILANPGKKVTQRIIDRIGNGK